jgi:hypothetical protein
MLRSHLPSDVRVRDLHRGRIVGRAPMRPAALTAGLVAWVGAALASLCYLLPQLLPTHRQ